MTASKSHAASERPSGSCGAPRGQRLGRVADREHDARGLQVAMPGKAKRRAVGPRLEFGDAVVDDLQLRRTRGDGLGQAYAQVLAVATAFDEGVRQRCAPGPPGGVVATT